jgi:hypothetical protein
MQAVPAPHVLAAKYVPSQLRCSPSGFISVGAAQIAGHAKGWQDEHSV